MNKLYDIKPDADGWRKFPNGNMVKLGDGVTLGDDVTLGDGVTSLKLNEHFRSAYTAAAPTHLFTKWVRPNRTSPSFDGGTAISYAVGETIEAIGEISDKQCAPGLHVLRLGYRPEWCGLCKANHDLIPLTVEVASEDILFAGLPTMDCKVRVKKLKVLD